MSQRYRIDDILRQDQNGAVFVAWDQFESAPILLHRFFPYGSEGAGFDEETQKIYLEAISDWKTTPVRGLRSILDGGCDEIDAIPYVVTQPITGIALQPASLGIAESELFLENGLQLLSELHAMSHQDVDWLDDELSSVEWIGENNHFLWSLNPLKWLGLQPGHNAVAALARQLEQLCIPLNHETDARAQRLHQWICAARLEQWSLHHAAIAWHGETKSTSQPTSPRAPRQLSASRIPNVRRATSQAPIIPPRQLGSRPRRNYTWWVLTACALLLGGVFYWGKRHQLTISLPSETVADIATTKKNKASKTAETSTRSEPSHASTPEASATAPAALAESSPQPAPAAAAAATEPEATTTASSDHPSTPIQVHFDREAELRANIGKWVEVTGTIQAVTVSSTGKSHYLQFSERDRDALRGRYLVKHELPAFQFDALKQHLGKTVTLRGFLEEEFGSKRVILDLNNADQIIESR